MSALAKEDAIDLRRLPPHLFACRVYYEAVSYTHLRAHET